MKNKLFRKHASVIPTGAPTLRSGQAARSGGIPSFKRFLAVLGMTALFCWSATAQNGVTVSNLNVEPGTVTFNVSWKNTAMPTLWSDTVWVFVDYNKASKMERLPISSATVSAGIVEIISGNNKGVRLIGNARAEGSFSTTVQLLTTTDNLSGVCAYASNYPPVGEYIDATHISFTGTPMYKIALEETGGEGTLTDYSDGLYTIRPGYTIQSFTDTTGAPGMMKCMLPATYTLQVSALSFCADSEGVQFALSGTEDGRRYQLYRDGVAVDGAELAGIGDAGTFTGSFDEAGTYTAWTIVDGKYCAIAMDGTHAIAEKPLPANPISDGASRHCPGTVTLIASSSPGAVIDWYADAAATTTLHTGENYTTPEIATSTTYYAQAWFENTGCLSERVPVSATVNMEGCCHEPGVTGVTFAAFNPCVGAPYGSTYTLTDDRDQKTYKVKYMPDDRWWMVQDLKFGDCTGTTNWYTDDSAAATTHTPTVAPGYVGHCVPNSYTVDGLLYNWPAVMQSINAYSGSSQTYCIGTAAGTASPNPASCRGICPAGWHVPTGTTDGEFAALCTAGGFTSPDEVRQSSWEPTNSEVYNEGNTQNKIYYASSTSYNSTLMYNFGVGAVLKCGSEAKAKHYAMPVRCLKNY